MEKEGWGGGVFATSRLSSVTDTGCFRLAQAWPSLAKPGTASVGVSCRVHGVWVCSYLWCAAQALSTTQKSNISSVGPWLPAQPGPARPAPPSRGPHVWPLPSLSTLQIATEDGENYLRQRNRHDNPKAAQIAWCSSMGAGRAGRRGADYTAASRPAGHRTGYGPRASGVAVSKGEPNLKMGLS